MDNGTIIPSGLEGFINTNTTIAQTFTERSIYLTDGWCRKHMSAGFTMILLVVHYESYANKCGR